MGAKSIGRRGRLAWLGVFALAAVAGSCNAEAFGCDDDSDCAGGGSCQWSNYCAFADDNCETGLRYGEHAGEFSELCVQPLPTDGGGTGPVDVGDSSSESEGTSTGTTEEDVDSGSPASCTCYDLPPGSGWQGPVLLRTGESPETVAACPPVAPSTLLDGRSGLNVEASSCEQAPSECTGSLDIFSQPDGCAGDPIESLELATGQCLSLNDFLDNPNAGVALGVPDGACECMVPPVVATIPAPTWSAAGTLCGGSADECGESGTCLPEADGIAGDAICVHQPGDVPCPLAGYSQKIVLYEAYDDTRGCPSCDRESACSVIIADEECSETFADLADILGSCGSLGIGSDSFGVTVTDVNNLNCAGSFAVSGDVVPVEPTTVCCLP